MSELKRNDLPTDRDYSVAEKANLGIDRLGRKSNSLRRVQAVQDQMFSRLEKKYNKRLKNQVKELRPGRIFAEDYSEISRSAENAKWYEEGAKIDLHTGLLTKLGLIDKLETIYTEIGRGVITKVMLLEFDLNGFKTINELYGHQSGDRAIKLFAEAIKGVARNKVDTAVRKQAGGDEFFLLLELRKKDTDVKNIVEGVVGRIFERVNSLMQSEDFKWDVFNEDGKQLLDVNDHPIYAAKGYEVIDKNNIGNLTINNL
ncbi:MAG: diguanylate cyclase [bacterium]